MAKNELDMEYINYVDELLRAGPMYLNDEEIDDFFENLCKIKDKGHHKNYGLSGIKLHTSWRHMKERCTNPNNNDYIWYLKKGITYCEEWEEFIPFMRWALANGYKTGYTIERINVNKGYYPDNCTWIPKKRSS